MYRRNVASLPAVGVRGAQSLGRSPPCRLDVLKRVRCPGSTISRHVPAASATTHGLSTGQDRARLSSPNVPRRMRFPSASSRTAGCRAGAVVEEHADRCVIRRGFQPASSEQAGTAPGASLPSGRKTTSSTLPSAPISTRTSAEAIGKFHPVDVVTTRPDAAKEDQLHRAKRLHHGMQLYGLATDLRPAPGSSAHSPVCHVACRRCPAALRLCCRAAATAPGSDPELRRSAARTLRLDRLCPGCGRSRREPGAICRVIVQEPGSPGLTVAQENERSP